jgi:hypothetical protein
LISNTYFSGGGGDGGNDGGGVEEEVGDVFEKEEPEDEEVDEEVVVVSQDDLEIIEGLVRRGLERRETSKSGRGRRDVPDMMQGTDVLIRLGNLEWILDRCGGRVGEFCC